jgi:hypothetical protein
MAPDLTDPSKGWAVIVRCVLFVTLGLLLAGCAADEQAQQQAEAEAQFQQAYRLLQNAASGVVLDADSRMTVEEYRLEQFAKATQQLRPLLSRGTTDQQAAVAMALSEALVGQARIISRDALSDWSARAYLSNELLRQLASASVSRTSAQRQGELDQQELVALLRQNLQKTRQEMADQLAAIEEQSEQLEGLRRKHEQILAAHRAKAADADQLEARVFDATGQLRFDLHVSAVAARRKADALGKQADELAARIDKAERALHVARAELKIYQLRAEELNKAIELASSRDQRQMQAAREMMQTAEARADELLTTLEQVTEAFSNKVGEPFEQARSLLAESVEVLDRALRAARGKSRDQVELLQASRRAELGQALRRYGILLANYRDLLSVLATHAEAALAPAAAQSVQETAANAADQAAQVNQQATEVLQAASEQLQALAERAGDDQVELAAYRRLVDVSTLLADATGELSYRQAITGYQQRITELRQQAE